MSNRWPSKTIIGLTGNIATGKSVVMRYAAEQGALAIDADKIAHDILTDEAVQRQIGERFGKEVQLADGRIDRAALGKIVFNDPAKLEELESVVHPMVRPRIEQIIAAAPHTTIFIEAIKLLEGELAAQCDQIWVANCGKFTQLQRLIVARGMDEEQAFARIVAQAPQAEKVAKADVVINTAGPLAETLKQVAAAWQGIQTTLSAAEPAPEPEPIPEPEPEPATPVAPEVKTEAAAEPEAEEVEAEGEIVVRRARPSDIPSIMLLIHRSTGGRVKPKRAEILMALSERGYLIGQIGSEISAVVGWYADKGFAAIEQIYIHPPEAAATTGAAVLREVGKTANELMCEAIFVFLLQDDVSDSIIKALTTLQYEDVADVATWPRVWRQSLEEEQPAGTYAMVRKLWNARVA